MRKMPAKTSGIAGQNQGHAGMGQGYIGANRGAAVGAHESLQNAQPQLSGWSRAGTLLQKIAAAMRTRQGQ